MGHAWGDLDAIGAAAGLCGAIRAIGADAYVFSDTDHTLAMPIIDRLRENLEDGSDLIINEETALILLKPQKLADQYAFLTWKGLSMLRYVRGNTYE